VRVKFFLFSFLFLLPGDAKSSAELGDNGYDSYLRDAHRQVRGEYCQLQDLRSFSYWHEKLFTIGSCLRAYKDIRVARDSTYFLMFS
jgi:hypothetical protein